MSDLLNSLILPAEQQQSQKSIPRSSPELESRLPIVSSSAPQEQLQPVVKMDVQPAPPQAPPSKNTFSIEEYEALYKPEYEESKKAAAAKKQTPSKKVKSVDPATLAPVALSARSSKNTIELHEKLQYFGVSQKLDYGGDTLAGWSAKTEILGEVFEEKGPFSSKQEAKEAVSGRALEFIKTLEAQGKISKPGKAKRSQSTLSTAEGQEQGKPEAGMNFVGLLQEFLHSTSSDQPTYQDYGLGTKFACTVTIGDIPETFGSMTEPFTSKKIARQNAAKCAVEHFQAKGVWPETHTDVGGIKKKAKVQSPDPKIKASDGAPSGQSWAQRVAQLALELGLETPQYIYAPTSPDAPGMNTVACHFRNGGEHAGPLGEVRNVHGKKTAKEECARLVVQYLEQLKERTLNEARDILGGASEFKSADVRMKEIDEDSESDDEFHDAQ